MSGRDPAPGVGPALVRELLAAARSLVDAAGERDSRLPGATITAVGWGTVELDRAERELGVALRLGAGLGLWRPGERDPELGAAARIGPAIGGGPVLLLLEPDTEGRLAATLARHGEGVVAVYVRASGGADLVIVPALTSARGGRPPTVLAARPPSATG